MSEKKFITVQAVGGGYAPVIKTFDGEVQKVGEILPTERDAVEEAKMVAEEQNLKFRARGMHSAGAGPLDEYIGRPGSGGYKN